MNIADIFRKTKGKVLSLDIGRYALKIVFLSLSREKVKLLNYDIKEFGLSGAQDKEKLIGEFITNFIKTHSIVEKDIIISLRDIDSLAIKRINLPNVPEKEMKEAVSWEVKEELSFNFEEAQVDWQLINEYTNEEGAKRKDVILACLKRDLIDKHIKITKEVGLNVLDIKFPPFNFAFLLEKLDISQKDSLAVLDIGAASSALSIYKQGKLAFTRDLPFNSEQLTSSMSGTLVSDKGRIELSKQRAEELKKEFGIPKDPNQILKDGIRASQIISLMRPALERLVSEITKSLDYYATNFDPQTPSVLYLAGGGSLLKGLDFYLKNELKLEVKKLSLDNVVDVGEEINKDKFNLDLAQLMSPIGAALGLNRKPNLLPSDYLIEKVEVFEKVSLRLIGVTLGLIFLASFILVRSQVYDYRNRLKHAKLHLDAIRKSGISELSKKISQRQILLTKIEANKIPPGWALKELSNLMPGTVVLDKLELNNEDKVLILAGYVISRKGRAEDELTVFMEALEASLFFDEANLHFSNKAVYEGKEASKFEIWCDLVK